MATNGIDVQELNNICAMIQQDPEIAKAEFRVQNTWVSGGHNKVEINSFYGAKQEHTRDESYTFIADEPKVLLGNDYGANPVEYLLLALSSCMTTSIVYHAAKNGIKIEELSSQFSGELDLQGFLDLSQDVPIGYKKIKVEFKVKTAHNCKELEGFYRFSPVYSMVSKAVPIEVTITSL